MTVELHVYFPFREEMGGSPVMLELPEIADVAAVVQALVARYPALERKIMDGDRLPQRHISALVNGVSIQFLRGFGTSVKPGDVVTLLPPVGGG